MKASILAIGTELTTGQILNKNASSLSAKLKGFGIIITAHLTVADDKKNILQALNFLEPQSDLLFITGGLGPTSDDFTRDVVADWAQTKMNFDETTWRHINERLTDRGFQVREMQKQQCYFPEGATILFNREGTAHAFKLNVRAKTIYVLPGPPREIEAIWQDHIQADLKLQTKTLNKLITKAWDTMGLGESDVAFKVEEIMKDRPVDLYLEIGYRVHLPYVEVKLTYSEKDAPKWSSYLHKVDAALSGVTITRNFTDVAQQVAEKIKDVDFIFYDFVSQGHLHTRLSTQLQALKNWSFKQSDVAPSVDLFESEDDFLALLPFEENQCIVIYSLDGQRQQKTIEAPMKSALMSERRRQYFAEMALVELSKQASKT